MRAVITRSEVSGVELTFTDPGWESREVYTLAELRGLGWDGSDAWIEGFLERRISERKEHDAGWRASQGLSIILPTDGVSAQA